MPDRGHTPNDGFATCAISSPCRGARFRPADPGLTAMAQDWEPNQESVPAVLSRKASWLSRAGLPGGEEPGGDLAAAVHGKVSTGDVGGQGRGEIEARRRNVGWHRQAAHRDRAR